MPDPVSTRSAFPVLAIGGATRPKATEAQRSLATVELPGPVDSRLVLLTEPRSAQADAFRLSRHRLQQRQDPHILAVTSAAAGEGKTTCAANLALAVAEENGPSVLLLDAHRARPALGAAFGLAPDDCVLAAASSRRYPLSCLADSRLHLGLALGEQGPITRAEADALRIALTDLRLMYDYVILDTGPALSGMDVHWIAELVDGVIFAVQRGVTDRRSLRRAIAGLSPAPLVGAIVLGA